MAGNRLQAADSQQANWDYHTGFDPAKNGWELPNLGSDFLVETKGQSPGGECYGMARLAQVMFDPGAKDKPGLYQETRNVEPLKRFAYAVKAQHELQSSALELLNTSSPDHASTLEQAKAAMKASGKPQVIILHTGDKDRFDLGVWGPKHAVLITGYRTEGNRTIYDMYDPNAPSLNGSHGEKTPHHTGNCLMGKSMTLVYNHQQKAFTVEADGQPVKFYRDYLYAQHDPDDKQQEVIKKARALAADMHAGRGLPKTLTVATSDTTWAARVVKDLKVNGVVIYYDPAILEKGADNPEAQAFIGQLMEQVEQGNTNFALQMSSYEETFTQVSLKTLLDNGDTTVGKLSRIRGCILKDDDIIIIGQESEDRPQIDLAVLAVALRTVYQCGSVPFVSLDPDPADVYGPQKVRVGGLPKELENTEFVRILLDADYDMKRIGLGELKLEIPGFQSWYDLLRERKPTGETIGRFWLVPQAMGAGDIRENGKAFLFDSEVQVQTERMKKVGDFFVGTGQSDPESEEAAAQLTSHYSEIEDTTDSFCQLHGLFDACKLAAVLRHKGTKHAMLDQLAQRAFRTVPHRDHYDGIGPKQVEGTKIQIGGGATARVRIGKHPAVKSDALGELVAGKDTVALEAMVPLPAGVNPELLVNAGIQDFMDNRMDDCVDKITRALDDDADQPAGYVFRGLAELQLGKLTQAAADLDRAVAFEPKLKATRAIVRAYAGLAGAAIADANEASRAFPDDEDILYQCALARVTAFDLPGAERDLNRLLSIAPLHRDGVQLRSTMMFLHKMGPAKAHRRVEHLRKLPIPIADAFLGGLGSFQHFEFDGALEQFEHCSKLVDAAADQPEVKAFYMHERCLMGLAMAKGARAKMLEKLDPAGYRQAVATARGHTDELIRLHPDWPSGYLLQQLAAQEGKPSPIQARDVLNRIARSGKTDDPLLSDLTACLGTDRAAAYMGLALMMGMGPPAPGEDRDQLEAAVRDIIRTIVEQLGHGPAADMAATLIRIEDKSPDEVLSELRRAYDAVPEKLPDDPATILCFNFFSTIMMGLELENIKHPGKPEEDAQAMRHFAFKFLRVTRRLDGLDFALLNPIAAMRYALLNLLAEYYERHFAVHPDVAALHQRVQQGPVPVDEVRTILNRVCDGFVAEARREGDPFVASFIQAMLYARQQADFRDALGVQGGDFNMLTVFHDAVDKADSEVELRTITFMVDALGLTANFTAGIGDADASAKARAMLSSLETKLKQKRLSAGERKLDWTGWDATPADDDVAAEVTTTAEIQAASAPVATCAAWATSMWLRCPRVPTWLWAAALSAGTTAGVFLFFIFAARMRRTARRRS